MSKKNSPTPPTPHSPTSFRAIAYGETIAIDSVNGNYLGIAHINPGGNAIFGRPDPVNRANAEFIVRACNSHDALLAAAKCALADLEGVMPEFEPSGDRTHPAWQTIKELKAVIKKAEAAK